MYFISSLILSHCDLLAHTKEKNQVLKKIDLKKKFILYLYAWREGSLCKTFKLMSNTTIANKQWWHQIGLQTLRSSDWEDRRSDQTSLNTAQMIKHLPAMWETQVWSLAREDSPGEGNDNPLQYPCLENPMDRGAW